MASFVILFYVGSLAFSHLERERVQEIRIFEEGTRYTRFPRSAFKSFNILDYILG
jgi:hypothetical protein